MNRMMTMTAAMATLSLFSCGGSGQALRPEVSFDGARAPGGAVLASDRVLMRFSGFEPRALVTVRARMVDGAVSFATFLADASGGFDTAQAPVAASYAGADPDGLFWSMGGGTRELLTTGALHVAVSAEVDGAEVLRARLERYATPDLLPVASPDLCGEVACPQPAPLIDAPHDPVPPGPNPTPGSESPTGDGDLR